MRERERERERELRDSGNLLKTSRYEYDYFVYCKELVRSISYMFPLWTMYIYHIASLSGWPKLQDSIYNSRGFSS